MDKRQITDELREVTFSYVVDEDGKFIAVCRMLACGGGIELDVQDTGNRDSTITPADLRDLSDKLKDWADFAEEI